MSCEFLTRRIALNHPVVSAARSVLAGLLLALAGLVAAPDQALAELPSTSATLAPPSIQAASLLDELFHSTGVLTQVAGLSILLDDELRNLAASPLFSPQDISKVRELMASLREDGLYRQLQTRVKQQFTPEDLAALYAWSQQPEVQAMLADERALQKMPMREQLRFYHLRMKETQPAAARVEQMQALDQARYQTQFETALKVSLRKNLLASVAVVKTRQALTESALDKELTDYRLRVSEDLKQHATTTYLFLFRKTPTESVQTLVDIYQNPLFIRFMNVCEQALENSFRVAREKGEESLRVAQH